ncbi:hypothetical protein OUZ56_033184 [Daphnia magna]|uniref:Uncharacterized protein n=1 Tax=Daphnia magna TaxID=35525 RepID=A0ABR0BAF0_9CRUS|nr:hypothetical protein OUZ56_033184 [Daphnia magna]
MEEDIGEAKNGMAIAACAGVGEALAHITYKRNSAPTWVRREANQSQSFALRSFTDEFGQYQKLANGGLGAGQHVTN